MEVSQFGKMVSPVRVAQRWKAPEVVAMGAVAFLVATNVYRAWTQSITIDEARSFNLFISGPVSRIFTEYEAANHVLQSFLSKISILLFGLSELTLRLPTLFGGLLYLTSAYRLSRHLFGRGWLLTLSVLALGLNPFLLDYLSAARGYGLGLGLLLWAFYHLVLYFDDQDEQRLFKAGIGLGLSIASCLVFLYPSVALAALGVGIVTIEGLLSGQPGEAKRRFWKAVDGFVGPGIVAAFVVLVVPLTRATRGGFFYGVRTLREFAGGMINPSFFHDPRVWKVGAYLPKFDSWFTAIRVAILPAFLLATLAVGVMTVRRWVRSRRLAEVDKNDRLLLLVGGTLALMFAMIVVNWNLLGVLYPSARTGIYWAPFVTLAVLGLIRKKYVGIPALAFALVSIGLFAGGFTTGYYAEWKYDRQTKDVARMIAARHGQREVRLGASWELESSMNFYRRRFRLAWLKPVEGTGPDGDYDYYYLMARDAGMIEKRGLRMLLRDPETGSVLAEKP